MVDGVELGRWLAQKMGASFRFLSAPLLVKDEAVALALRSERINQETLTIAAQAEVAVIGIGTPVPEYSSLLRAGYLSRSDLEELMEAGVVGDIVAHHPAIRLAHDTLYSGPSLRQEFFVEWVQTE